MTKAEPTLKSRTDELREMTKIACEAPKVWTKDLTTPVESPFQPV
jgi:hypothetical protein